MGHDNDRRQPRPRRKFSDEFKRDAVDLVLTTGRPIAEVAAELGVYDSTLGNWSAGTRNANRPAVMSVRMSGRV